MTPMHPSDAATDGKSPMPRYAYRHCGEVWEETRHHLDRLTRCPKCGEPVRPTIHAPALARDRRTEGK